MSDVIDAVVAGGHWDDTAILLVYDDSGGYNDHKVPPVRIHWRDELADAPDVATGGRGAWVHLRFAAESAASASTEPAETTQALEMASK